MEDRRQYTGMSDQLFSLAQFVAARPFPVRAGLPEFPPHECRRLVLRLEGFPKQRADLIAVGLRGLNERERHSEIMPCSRSFP